MAEDEAGALVPMHGRMGLQRAGQPTAEAGPIMDGGGCVALAISEIRLAPPSTVRYGHRGAPFVRSVCDA